MIKSIFEGDISAIFFIYFLYVLASSFANLLALFCLDNTRISSLIPLLTKSLLIIKIYIYHLNDLWYGFIC